MGEALWHRSGDPRRSDAVVARRRATCSPYPGAGAPRPFRAWLPHPSALSAHGVPAFGQRYHYTQINFEESRLLPGAVNDPVLNARRLCTLTGERTQRLRPPDQRPPSGAGSGSTAAGWRSTRGPVDVVDDTGCGDSFAAALVVGCRLLG